MRKKFRITVDDRSYNVLVEDLDQVAETPAALVPLAPTPPAPVPVPTVARSLPKPVPAAGAGTIAAPIGGVVRSINVSVGRAVAVGDKVAIIEAMKMKTEVVSKIAGAVTNIFAKVNEPVETGEALFTLG